MIVESNRASSSERLELVEPQSFAEPPDLGESLVDDDLPEAYEASEMTAFMAKEPLDWWWPLEAYPY